MLYLHPTSKSLLQKVRQLSKLESEGDLNKQHKMRGIPYAATALIIRGFIGLKRNVFKNELRSKSLANADLDYLEKLKNLRKYFLGTFPG
ncbi:MAG: hypothetical protein ABI325_12160 [Ginsengibacter sp.]